MADDADSKKKMLGWLVSGGLALGAAVGGAFIVGPSESLQHSTYIDPVGIATVCYGHTGKDVKLGQTYTTEECLNKLADDLGSAYDAVNSTIKMPLTIYQQAALVSFTYNVGEGNLKKSTLAYYFNHNQPVLGCDELLKWVYAKGHKLKGLEYRRDTEHAMCLGQVEIPNVRK